jgi:hypothetical protein
MDKWRQNPKAHMAIRLVGVPLAGFALLNAAFAIDAAYQLAVLGMVGLFQPLDMERDAPGLAIWLHGGFLMIVAAASWLVWRSRLPRFAKATWLVVPVAATYAVT